MIEVYRFLSLLFILACLFLFFGIHYKNIKLKIISLIIILISLIYLTLYIDKNKLKNT